MEPLEKKVSLEKRILSRIVNYSILIIGFYILVFLYTIFFTEQEIVYGGFIFAIGNLILYSSYYLFVRILKNINIVKNIIVGMMSFSVIGAFFQLNGFEGVAALDIINLFIALIGLYGKRVRAILISVFSIIILSFLVITFRLPEVIENNLILNSKELTLAFGVVTRLFLAVNLISAIKDAHDKEQELLIKKNIEVKGYNDEIVAQNEEIKQLNEELSQINDQLVSVNDVLRQKNTDLNEALKKLKDAQVQLIQSEKMVSLGTMTAGIAHEINNPVNFISGSLQALESLIQELNDENMDEKEKKEIKDDISHMVKNASIGIEKVAGLVAGLKTFSFQGKDKEELVKVSDVVDSVLLILNAKFSQGIELETTYRTVPNVKASRNKLQQVVMNITDNALFALGNADVKEPKITIEIKLMEGREGRKKKDWVEISIANNGPIIPEDEIARIFDPFYTTKDPGKGTGLGLYISYTIITEHKGKIVAENTEDGVVFKILLPI